MKDNLSHIQEEEEKQHTFPAVVYPQQIVEESQRQQLTPE